MIDADVGEDFGNSVFVDINECVYYVAEWCCDNTDDFRHLVFYLLSIVFSWWNTLFGSPYLVFLRVLV